MKIPAQYLDYYLILSEGFLIILVLALALFRKKKATVFFGVIMIVYSAWAYMGRKTFAYDRVPQGDVSLIRVSVRDDGIYYQGKKVTILETIHTEEAEGLKAYRPRYTYPVFKWFETGEGYVYKLNM